MSTEKPLTKKDYLKCFGISVLIAVTYVIWLGIIVDWIEEGEINFKLLPEASGLIFLGLVWNNGKPVWNKGKKMPQQQIEKIRKIRTGWKLSEITKQKISIRLKGNKNNLGNHLSEETKRKIGLAHKGKNCNNRKGTHHSQETILKIKAQKGWKHTEETKQKLKEHWSKNDPPMLGVIRSDSVKSKIKAGRKFVLPKVSSDELEIAKILNEQGIEFETQKLFEYKDWYRHVDFFIEPNFVFEIDNVWIHTRPRNIELDKQEDKCLPKIGIKLTRIKTPSNPKPIDFKIAVEKILEVVKND